MKKVAVNTLLLLIAFNSLAFGQKVNSQTEKAKILQSCVGFLKWYKKNSTTIETRPLVTGFNPDTVKKDSIVKVDMNAVETYLTNFKKSGYVTDAFLNHIRSVYKNVSDTLTAYPLKDYFGPVPGLESDVIFGFGKEDILDIIKQARVRRYLRIYNKALLSMRLSYTTELIFVLTRNAARWQIDYVGFNGDNKFNIGGQ